MITEEQENLSSRKIDFRQLDRRKKQMDYSLIIGIAIFVFGVIGGLWQYSLNLSQDVGKAYAEIQSKLSIMEQKVDYLVKFNDQFSTFKDIVKEQISAHDTEIKLIKQELKILNENNKIKYNEVTDE